MAETTPQVLKVVPGEDKWDIRKKIWDYLENSDLVNFPRPVTNRIPNFKGAAEAGEKVATMPVFQMAHTVKVNPDKPQEDPRFKVLEHNKTLLVPTPRLRQGLFNKIIPPADCNKDVLRICSRSQGVKEYSKPIGLDEKVSINLIIVGSVAVSPKGWRIGKGEGFADLEYAMMRTMDAVDDNTVVVTTVHDCQVFDELPEELFGKHDLSVDWIVTPTRIIECTHRAKPEGVIWSMLTRDKLNQIPVLRKLRARERDAGKDVRIKDDLEPRPRSQNLDGGEGGDDGEDGGQGGPRQRRMRPRPRRRQGSRGDSRGEEGTDTEKENMDSEGQRRQRKRRPNRRRNTGSEGDGERDDVRYETGDGEEDGDKHAPRRRRPQPRRRPRGRPDSETLEDGDKENDAGEGEDRRERRTPRRRPINNAPAIYIGSLPRVRVSDFKTQVKGHNVQPLRVLWRGSTGHAFLQFESQNQAEEALDALKDLEISGKSVKVEMSNRFKPGSGGDHAEEANLANETEDADN